MTFTRAARSQDVAGPRFVRVEVNGKPVLLTRMRDGTPVAFGPICPHQGKPMDDGVLWNGEIDCPHHHYTYDPLTGQNRFPRRVFPGDKARQVRDIHVYEVKEEDGWILVGPRRKPQKPAPPHRTAASP